MGGRRMSPSQTVFVGCTRQFMWQRCHFLHSLGTFQAFYTWFASEKISIYFRVLSYDLAFKVMPRPSRMVLKNKSWNYFVPNPGICYHPSGNHPEKFSWNSARRKMLHTWSEVFPLWLVRLVMVLSEHTSLHPPLFTIFCSRIRFFLSQIEFWTYSPLFSW